ncbi:hypothetical protein KIW84_074570 [Lathyrus oleraceus]|uniref:Uncharacterized protein n=1 Tax=Pisum sativum TaxID=3888 RepID=A0A9D4VRM1_PEA|nr:hypothetical protein KIW84_074570 [Pisum sativum]
MLEEITFGKSLDQKEREIRNLQGQVKDINYFLRASHERKPEHVENSFFDPLVFPTYFKQLERPSPFYPTYVSSPPDQVRYIPTAYRPKSARITTPSTSKTKGKVSCLSASSSDSKIIPDTPSPKIQKEEETLDKGFQATEITRNHESPKKITLLLNHQHKREMSPRQMTLHGKYKEEESFFEEEFPEETLVPERTKPKDGPWFTFDDITPSSWRKRLLEFGTQLETQMMKTSADSYKIIEEFCCRMTSTMKEWYPNLRTFKQDELHHLETTTNILGVLHHEFISDMEIFYRKNRQEFFEMKCCSLKTKNLDKHYHMMEQRYYVLNGYNDPSLKNTYVSSLPEELQPDIHRMLAATQKDIKTMSLGQIHQPLEGDLESLNSDQSSTNEEISFTLQDSSSDEASFSESKDDKYIIVYSFKEIGSSLPTPPLPCVEVHVLATKFSRPKKVITYMDTGAQITIMNPSILPVESWVTHVAYFVAADGKVFKTDLMTREKIGIKLFPYCIVWTRVIGINLPNKDIMVGIDVYSVVNRLQILLTGFKFKRELKPYFGILKLY